MVHMKLPLLAGVWQSGELSCSGLLNLARKAFPFLPFTCTMEKRVEDGNAGRRGDKHVGLCEP